MKFKVGDFVTRSSYNNDIVFRIVSINNDVADLYGLNVRLKADALLSDLILTSNTKTTDDELESFDDFNLDRSEYFYIPGTITFHRPNMVLGLYYTTYSVKTFWILSILFSRNVW